MPGSSFPSEPEDGEMKPPEERGFVFPVEHTRIVPSDDPERKSKTTRLQHTVLASAAAICLGKIVTHPVDTMKARLQVITSAGGTSTRSKLYSAVRAGGLYEGFSVAVVGSLPAGALYMSCYELLRGEESFLSLRMLGSSSENKRMRGLVDFTAAFLAEAVSCVFWCPVDVVKERLQVQKQLSPVYQYKNGRDAVAQILKKEGLRGLYRAYGATLAAFGPQTAINLATYEQLEVRAMAAWSERKMLRKGEGGPQDIEFQAGAEVPLHQLQCCVQPTKPPWLTFTCACVSGCLACLVTTPLDLAKLRMQVVRAERAADGKVCGKNKKRLFDYSHVGDAVYRIGTEEGLRGLFRGGFLRCCLWVPQTAIFLATFKTLMATLEGEP